MSPILHIELKSGELLVLQLTHVCQIHAQDGAFWLTIAGKDVCLREEQGAELPCGKLLIEGQGRLTLKWPGATRGMPLRRHGLLSLPFSGQTLSSSR